MSDINYHVKFLVSKNDHEKVLHEKTYPNKEEAMIMYKKYLGDDGFRYNKFDYYYFKTIIIIDPSKKPNSIKLIDSELYTETEARKEKINRFLEDEKD